MHEGRKKAACGNDRTGREDILFLIILGAARIIEFAVLCCGCKTGTEYASARAGRTETFARVFPVSTIVGLAHGGSASTS